MKQRHKGKVPLHQPEGIASVCHQCIDSIKVGKYFAALKAVVAEVGNPDRIRNMNEISL